jgi:hypothetical protein
MRHFKFLIGFFGFVLVVFAVTLRVRAVGNTNTVCSPTGGCSAPCENAGNGGSGNIISASQQTQCSPDYLANCTPSSGNLGVCGVNYTYSGSNCDPTTIVNSYYVFGYFCTAG